MAIKVIIMDIDGTLVNDEKVLPGRISSNTGPKIVHIGGKNELFFAYSEIPSYLCAPVRNAGKCGKI